MTDYAAVARMAQSDVRLHPDFLAAMEAFVASDEAEEKARHAHHRALDLLQRREAELRAVYERLTGSSDG